jgi:hypothetical protein
MFFQGPSEGALIRNGARIALSEAPEGGRPDVATGDETR